MASITFHVVIPFSRNEDGVLIAEDPVEVPSAAAAIRRAEAVAHAKGGAVAFSRTDDPATGEFSDATVLAKFGNVPDELSEKMG